MKLFTKIALGIAGFFTSIGVICLVVALILGFRWTDFLRMVNEGKFNFGPEDDFGFHISFFDDDYDGHDEHDNYYDYDDGYGDYDEDDNYYDDGYGDYDRHDADKDDTAFYHGGEYSIEDNKVCEIPHECTRIFIEYGAGTLGISYADVSTVQIVQENVKNFSVTSSEVDKTLYIKGSPDVTGNSNASLAIILPQGTQLEVVDLEIGASKAKICDLTAKECSITVGAGHAELSDICVDKLDLEVGVGQAEVKNLSVQKLDVEAGVGQVDIEVAGAETDYNYDVECGIGEVMVGNHSFGGVGAEQNITNIGASHHMDIECGMGRVGVHFTCDTANEGCEDESHHHKGGH